MGLATVMLPSVLAPELPVDTVTLVPWFKRVAMSVAFTYEVVEPAELQRPAEGLEAVVVAAEIVTS